VFKIIETPGAAAIHDYEPLVEGVDRLTAMIFAPRLQGEAFSFMLERTGVVMEAIVVSAATSLGVIDALEPSVVLLLLSTPQSFALADRLHRRNPSLPLIACAISDDAVPASARSAVDQFVNADASAQDLADAVRRLMLANVLGSRSGWRRQVSRAQSPLTSREEEVVELLAERLSNKEIARILHVELSTVKNHVHNVFVKLGISSRLEIPRRFVVDAHPNGYADR
jgi:two-component system, NarL family, nitrate/nitrite response regulator NarL